MLFNNMIARKPRPVDPVADHPFHFAPGWLVLAMPKLPAVPPYISSDNISYQTLLNLLPVSHIVALMTALKREFDPEHRLAPGNIL